MGEESVSSGGSVSETEPASRPTAFAATPWATTNSKRRFRASDNRRMMIHDMFDFALMNFNALEELFMEMGVTKGCHLSEKDLKRALTHLEGQEGLDAEERPVLGACSNGNLCATSMDFCSFQMHMLRVRYLKHTLKPVVDAWRQFVSIR